MANKLILVPEDMYRGLMSTPLAADNDDLSAEFVKQKMKNAKKNKKVNASARNTLYNQEFRRWLKMRKEAKEKPIKVEMSNGVRVVTSNDPKADTIISTEQDGNTTQDGTVDEEEQVLPKSADLSVQTTPLSAAKSDTPKKTPRKRSAKKDSYAQKQKTRAEKFYEEKAEAIKDIIMKNPQNFGVTVRGNVLNKKGESIAGTNLAESLKRIVNPSPATFSPPGTTTLRSKLSKDPVIKKIISSRYQVGSGGFRPELWKKKSNLF